MCIFLYCRLTFSLRNKYTTFVAMLFYLDEKSVHRYPHTPYTQFAE